LGEIVAGHRLKIAAETVGLAR